ncbi:hypothetical protein MMC34_004699 [Xylographa carneopallida]|nr:hypothetical protein [Xylographa carneopallida]
MNGLQGPGLGHARHSSDGLNSAVAAPNVGSPSKARPGSSTGKKRTQDLAGVEASPGSVENWEERDESRIGVKRACNECRQQKLRCDVVQEPFRVCSRCRRCNLECRIDSNFRRVGKRKKNAEMEREIVELRSQLASQQSSPSVQQTASPFGMAQISMSPTIPHLQSSLDQYMGSQEAVASLLDLKSGLDGGSFLRSPNGQIIPPRRLDDVVLTAERIRDLFQIFFTLYHPYLPLLNADKLPDYYYDACPLLFWTIVAVASRRYTYIPSLISSVAGPLSRLLWATIADIPQSYHVVKALCILCTWPLPISSTSADPTFMLSGLMMQISMQIGLHRPSHAQDFSKFQIELRDEELKDRVKTWAACNVVAQRVATGYGQPSTTFYDWTLGTSTSKELSFRLPDEVDTRLRIEIFSDKVTKALYRNHLDPVGLADSSQKSALTDILTMDFEDLKDKLKPHLTPMNLLYLRATRLHQHLSVFFDSPDTKDYRMNLLALWTTTTNFLESAFNVETPSGNVILYATNYILQMIIAAGFTLLKLLNSFFANFIDLEYGKALFTRTISTIRNISVTNSDLPVRLAEVLAQLWRGGGAGSKLSTPKDGNVDSSLQLKVCCRMSMSLVYDSVWRWREEFQAKGRGNLESALKNPTNPDSAADSSASSVMDPTLTLPPSSTILGGAITPNGESTYEYEVFDPLNWMLDGLVDFPYSFTGPGMSGL